MNWKPSLDNSYVTSQCGNYRITMKKQKGEALDEFGNNVIYKQYQLWRKVNMQVSIATGKKRNPFDCMGLDIYCELLTVGTKKHVRAYFENSR